MSTPSAVIVGVGAERGLGAALCRRFAVGGHHVLVAGRTAGRIEQVAQTIRAAGGRGEPVVAEF
jgi:NADP-dependent 3-hydroxy acid dehydrogenase YdfG